MNTTKLYISSLYTFKVFKTTTRFKKYSIGLTKFIRKSLAKRKHKTNWLVFSYALQRWLFFYLKSKQFIRYYQAMGMFNFSIVGISPSFISRYNEKFAVESGLFFLSCSKSILKTFLVNKPNFLLISLYDNTSTIMLSGDIEDLNNNSDINPSLLVYDNVMYPYNFIVKNSNKDLTYKLININFIISLKVLINLYKILIKLTLYITHQY